MRRARESARTAACQTFQIPPERPPRKTRSSLKSPIRRALMRAVGLGRRVAANRPTRASAMTALRHGLGHVTFARGVGPGASSPVAGGQRRLPIGRPLRHAPAARLPAATGELWAAPGPMPYQRPAHASDVAASRERYIRSQIGTAEAGFMGSLREPLQRRPPSSEMIVRAEPTRPAAAARR